MPKNIYIAPTSVGSGLTSVCLGLVRALDRVGVRVAFFKPISQSVDAEESADRSIHFIRAAAARETPDALTINEARDRLSRDDTDGLLEEIVALYETVTHDADLVIVEGLVPDPGGPYIDQLNTEIARLLDAEVILVASHGGHSAQAMNDHLEFSARLYDDPALPNVIGAIINKAGAPVGQLGLGNDMPTVAIPDFATETPIFRDQKLHLLGTIPWNEALISPRTIDVARQLNALVVHEGKAAYRRVHRIVVCARTVANFVEFLRPATLVVTPGDREDVILATCMAALSGVPLAGLVLTGGLTPDARIINLCGQAFDAGLPLLTLEENTFSTATKLANLNREVPIDDLTRIESVMSDVAARLDVAWLVSRLSIRREQRLSPPAFRHRLSEVARAAHKRIVLPEGDEPRTVRAAIMCHQRKLAHCILVGRRSDIEGVAKSQELVLPEDLDIIEPDSVREQYVQPMVELRKHKGLTADMARAQLEDNVVLATMMVALGEVDGLVSGAVHTTANTVRPALQLIKTRPDARIVSSVFFMCLPDQVLVYGDCAINPNPSATELADIAIQSANSAAAFGIEPRVAMISYSTGDSGTGDDVEKVREATKLAKAMRPDLIIDGPLQYDAAANAGVAKSKAPNSPVAGRATVYIFPDLNTGNTTYKAVQRSANVISVGPMLQGLLKPVNDLSRGALVEDIVLTIALTAVQAHQADVAK